jgi:hypothetical protein
MTGIMLVLVKKFLGLGGGSAVFSAGLPHFPFPCVYPGVRQVFHIKFFWFIIIAASMNTGVIYACGY